MLQILATIESRSPLLRFSGSRLRQTGPGPSRSLSLILARLIQEWAPCADAATDHGLWCAGHASPLSTSALDNRTEELVSESPRELAATRVIVAHGLSTVINADRI